MRVLHIVPAVPPEINGVGDYARQLYRHWPEPRPEWHVAALRVPAGAPEAWPGPTFHEFSPTAQSLLETLRNVDPDVVALHYVGYGYHPKGIPLWLVQALGRCSASPRLVVFLHELWASGPPWKSAFWTRPFQIGIVRTLLGAASGWATSCDLYHQRATRLGRGRCPGQKIPIGSNFPTSGRDPASPKAIERGELTILVAGQPRTRLRSIRTHLHLLRQLQGEARLARILLAGSSPQDDAVTNETARLLREAGLCRVEEVFDFEDAAWPELTSRASVAVLPEPLPTVHKSSIYAACVGCGLWCVLPQRRTPSSHWPLGQEDLTEYRADRNGGYLQAWRFECEKLNWMNIVRPWIRLAEDSGCS